MSAGPAQRVRSESTRKTRAVHAQTACASSVLAASIKTNRHHTLRKTASPWILPSVRLASTKM